MIEEVLPDIFKIEVPLPKNPLKILNSYLIKGKEKNLLIDTGFNQPECKEALVTGIELLGIDCSDVDFFITHMHWDHAGLVHALAKKESTIYISETDANILRATWSSAYWQTVNSFFLTHGYPQCELLMDPADMENFILDKDIAFTYVKQGDVLEYGNYRLACMSTPGHTPGHMCLYEPEHRFLIGGDHILSHISSNITAKPGINDSLGQYLESLDKVESMDISLVLPGHRNIFHDYRIRIADLKLHHMNRLAEILPIIINAPMNAYQVASLMHWDLSYDSWEQFPNAQKWFATGEAVAHLDHLALHNKIQKRLKEERIIYEI